jgi:hypothetical protein
VCGRLGEVPPSGLLLKARSEPYSQRLGSRPWLVSFLMLTFVIEALRLITADVGQDVWLAVVACMHPHRPSGTHYGHLHVPQRMDSFCRVCRNIQ